MRIPMTNIDVRSPIEFRFPLAFVQPEVPWGWAQKAYTDLVDGMADEVDGRTYMSMMYAGFVRECKIPAEFVALVELRNKDGSKVYYFTDQRDWEQNE